MFYRVRNKLHFVGFCRCQVILCRHRQILCSTKYIANCIMWVFVDIDSFYVDIGKKNCCTKSIINSFSRFLLMLTNVMLMSMNSLFYRVHCKLHLVGFCRCTNFLLYREQSSKITTIHNNKLKNMFHKGHINIEILNEQLVPHQ